MSQLNFTNISVPLSAPVIKPECSSFFSEKSFNHNLCRNPLPKVKRSFEFPDWSWQHTRQLYLPVFIRWAWSVLTSYLLVESLAGWGCQILIGDTHLNARPVDSRANSSVGAHKNLCTSVFTKENLVSCRKKQAEIGRFSFDTSDDSRQAGLCRLNSRCPFNVYLVNGEHGYSCNNRDEMFTSVHLQVCSFSNLYTEASTKLLVFIANLISPAIWLRNNLSALQNIVVLCQTRKGLLKSS